jgi:hypothetical protein
LINPLKNKRKGGTIEKTGILLMNLHFRRIKICRDPVEDQEVAAEAADLVAALAAEAEASAAVVADMVEDTTTDRIITGHITVAFTAGAAVALAV